MVERGGEPRTIWWGFRWICIAGTGVENWTFFMWTETGDVLAEAPGEESSRQRNSWSHRNGREYWFQPVYRHRIRFIPNQEDKKFLTVFEDLVGTSVEQSQRRFRSVSNEHKLSSQESPGKRLRLRRNHMMKWRSGETRDNSLHFQRNTSGGNSGCSMNLPGRERCVP